jgi:hypothetical protein
MLCVPFKSIRFYLKLQPFLLIYKISTGIKSAAAGARPSPGIFAFFALWHFRKAKEPAG